MRRRGLERRSVAVSSLRIATSVRAAGAGGSTIVGHAAVFDSPTQIEDLFGTFTETIARGAFRKALARADDVLGLFNHDVNHVLGSRAAGTMRVREDDRGLAFDIDLPLARADILELIQRGDVRGASFGFTVAEGGERWTDGGTKRLITEVERLYDLGPVAMPAYPATDVDVARANSAADELRRDLEAHEDGWAFTLERGCIVVPASMPGGAVDVLRRRLDLDVREFVS